MRTGKTLEEMSDILGISIFLLMRLEKAGEKVPNCHRATTTVVNIGLERMKRKES
jgi:hypothetical protein